MSQRPHKKITTRAEYDALKNRVEMLISEATSKGLLEPDMDNDYTREISNIGHLMADYEDEYLNILPLREKNPLLVCIENYLYAHNMKQKEGAKMLGVNESVLSQIMCGKRKITMPLAKKLHSVFNIEPSIILLFA